MVKMERRTKRFAFRMMNKPEDNLEIDKQSDEELDSDLFKFSPGNGGNPSQNQSQSQYTVDSMKWERKIKLMRMIDIFE